MILIEKNYMGVACSTEGVGRGVYRVLLGKPEGDYRGDPNVDQRIILR
jgi:hypothetical protein